MTIHLHNRRRVVLLCICLSAVLLLAWGLQTNLQVVEIGDSGPSLLVRNGNLFCHEYTHSMYGAQVVEKFRIEDGHFRIFHVMTQSDAVLEYFAIEKRGEHNVDGTFQKFSIPAASIGKHILKLEDYELSLDKPEQKGGSIHVKLLQVPFWAYAARLIRR
ncbi:hypothetical protein [Desulfomonile tiedjei]|uniref:DUF1850 domain-containing protein n=1 Tax=Desulfomonile tiedjei (strain ATCC 49306 / DSM 6799 / DCB-1) TaxID=706587 RepID=I4C1V6_DESTA|nr:hypothetical protein [Desulfomonile tiedjei]AFM23547.1 hypothetical protein Desti_0823 [Desulfomonile tiedjei DSM 6799]